MSAITTHILDVSTGRPAASVDVELERRDQGEQWTTVGRGATDADGRLRTLTAADVQLVPGTYRLVFHTRGYFDRAGTRSFYPFVSVVFEVAAGDAHYHVPLLLSPFGYSTYRGS
jgi:5-hydroxyisourate hydrolase